MSGQPMETDEARRVRERYARRDAQADARRYSLLDPYALAVQQERLRALRHLLARLPMAELAGRDILELGCGAGGNLLDLLRLGAEPQRLKGIELLPERAQAARAVLPAAVTVWQGDALAPAMAQCLPPQSQDLVLQFTVFSSLLSDDVQQAMAARMWHWLRPGGTILWHDFVYGNPRNPDVRGVPLARVRALFPEGRLDARRVTLAPPIGRRACRIHPALYPLLNSVPWLRTHVLCLVRKPA